MEKAIEWIDQSKQKIGSNGKADMLFVSEIGQMCITQVNEDKFKLECTDNFGECFYLKNSLDKPTLFGEVEGLGLSAENLVVKEKDLGDFREPVVMHEQSVMEKEFVLSSVSQMEPGDELTYSLPDKRSDDGEYVAKGSHVTIACVKEGCLQYLCKDVLDSKKTEKCVPLARQMSVAEISGTNDGECVINNRPDGSIMNPCKAYPVSEIQDVQITKGKFTQTEISAIRAGNSIDYDAVCERHPIKDKQTYISYVLAKNRPDFTHGEHKAIETMNIAWNLGVNGTFFGNATGLDTEVKARIKNANPEDKKKILSAERQKIHLREQDRLKKQAFDTEMALSDANNTERMDAVVTLRRAAKDFDEREAEWRKLGVQCHQIADELPKGTSIAVVSSIVKGRDANTDMLVDALKDLYPNIDKGLTKLNETQVQNAMEDFYKTQQQQLNQEQRVPKKEKAPSNKRNRKKSLGKTGGR